MLMLVLAAVATLAAREAAGAPPLDLVLANGRVVDGTGAPWFRADVGIRGDRIAAMGDLSKAPARQRIDVQGRIVAPGFIDMLGQSELNVLVDPRVESKIRQGFTTEVTGEGLSVAPMNGAMIAEQKPWLDRYGLTVDWTDLDGYWRRFRAARPTMNLATFVGAAQVRGVVLGLGDVQPTPDQLRRMEGEVEKAMRQGALGLSSALIYPPGSYARTPELVALARAAARHGGIYATHVRGEEDQVLDAVGEAIDIGREAKIPVEIWHLKVAFRRNFGRIGAVLERIEAARAQGVDVTADTYPYVAGANGLDANVPGWAKDGGVDAMLARFRDPAQRARIAREIREGGPGAWAPFSAAPPEDILLLSCVSQDLKRFMGKRLSEVAAEMGKAPEEALIDLVAADRANVTVARFLMSEEDVREIMRRPWVAFDTDAPGQATDGPFARDLTHPRAFGTAPRVLGRYVREEKVLRLEDAVRKLTSLPARRVGLWDRGVLRPGMAADVVVFDPDRIVDRATFENPDVYPEGVLHVLVNGRLVLEAGRMTDQRSGRPLLGPGAARRAP